MNLYRPRSSSKMDFSWAIGKPCLRLYLSAWPESHRPPFWSTHQPFWRRILYRRAAQGGRLESSVLSPRLEIWKAIDHNTCPSEDAKIDKLLLEIGSDNITAGTRIARGGMHGSHGTHFSEFRVRKWPRNPACFGSGWQTVAMATGKADSHQSE